MRKGIVADEDMGPWEEAGCQPLPTSFLPQRTAIDVYEHWARRWDMHKHKHISEYGRAA